MIHSEISENIIKCFYKVYNELGYGFLEKVYENAMILELEALGFNVKQQENIKVYYNGKQVGDYYADLLINNLVIIELKAAESICKEHENQLINYLKATEIELGILLNFGKKPEFKRKIYSNSKKRVELG
jgi:GxxExxY protein